MIIADEGRSLEPRLVQREIRASGFTPGRMELTARGSLERSGDNIHLRVEGGEDHIVLEGGSQWEDLPKRIDAEDEWVITGFVTLPEDESPLRLSVESFEH